MSDGSGLFEQLPPPVLALVGRLCREPTMSRNGLREELERFRLRVREAAQVDEFLDLALGMNLADRCERMLSDLDSLADSRLHPLIELAIRYLVLRDDAEGDVDSIIGFDDDRLVVEIVEAEFARVRRFVAGQFDQIEGDQPG